MNPDNESDGNGTGVDLSEFEELIEKLIAIIGIIVLLLIVSFVKPVADIFIFIIKTIFKILISIIKLPFKILSSLFNLGKRKKP